MIGCLIYSDPRDDGYFAGDVYPGGPFRPEFGAQRGSVMDMPIHPGAEKYYREAGLLKK